MELNSQDQVGRWKYRLLAGRSSSTRMARARTSPTILTVTVAVWS